MNEPSHTGRIVGGIDYEEYIAPEPEKRYCCHCNKPLSRYNPEASCHVCTRKMKDRTIREYNGLANSGSREKTVNPRTKNRYSDATN